MKRGVQIIIFLILIASFAGAYEYHMPVNIHPIVSPAVLMPGDAALVAIELENGAAAYGVGKDAGASSNAQSALLSTPLNRTFLKGTDEIQVISADHQDLGMIGPSDKITIYYKIKAANTAPSGPYLLDFTVEAGYDILPINREIPIKVDPTAVSIARAEVPTKPSISLNVANPRDNTLNAVTIMPSGRGYVFSPEEYYIGTMDPDEVFTISFGIQSENPYRSQAKPANLSFVANFKNGDNWHKSDPYITSFSPPQDDTKKNNNLLPVGGAILTALVLGGFLYRRRKLSKKPNNKTQNGRSSLIK